MNASHSRTRSPLSLYERREATRPLFTCCANAPVAFLAHRTGQQRPLGLAICTFKPYHEGHAA